MSEYNERESGPLESHLKSLIQKLTEVREELADQENNYRIVPLSHEDSGVVLSVCEPIGADLIPLDPWIGSLFLGPEQIDQLNEAMAEFRDPPSTTP
jgi:hypothetical protein